jgi:photosystem II stability/assembly factor-like uncharacterized protein
VNVVAIAPDDPAVVFAATNRALFRSPDGGTSWTAAPTGGVEALSADRQTGAVFVGTASGLYRTVDHGVTLERVADGPGRVAESPDGALYAATTKGLLRSPDGGSHWETVRDTPCSRVAIDPGNPRIILVAESMRLLRSTDRGTTWTEVLCRCQIGTFATFTSLVFDGDAVYAAAQREYKGSGGVFRSTDTGASWTQVAGQSFTSLSVDSGALVATRESGVARSADRGETWTGLYPGKRYVSTVAVGPSGTLWAGANSQCSSSWGLACPKVGGGVLSSHDGGSTWEEPHASIERLTAREVLLDPKDPRIIFLGSDEAGLWITRSGGR